MAIVDSDLVKADLALVELPRARNAPLKQSQEIVRHLANTTQNNSTRSANIENAQAHAWLAICAIAQALNTENHCADELWDKAIVLTQHWRALLI